ncbi:unnamed protein product [Effrenium voratum]|nr:unnamed protein product [Effrenium voratum]
MCRQRHRSGTSGELEVPELAALHLEPSLLPAILGFFTYTVGKAGGKRAQDRGGWHSQHLSRSPASAGRDSAGVALFGGPGSRESRLWQFWLPPRIAGPFLSVAMKCVLAFLALGLATAADVTPVGKVVEMLKDMKAQGLKDKQAEEVQFAAYKQFCELTEAEKTRVIADAKDKIEVLEAEVEKSDTDAARLAEELSAHAADIEAAAAEKEAAGKVRDTERADFAAMLKDYTESVDAIGRALKELKAKDKEGALVQLKTLQLPAKVGHSLHALLAEGFEDKLLSSLGAPEYEFQSGGVVKMLEKLEDKFVDERATLEKEEMAKKHSHALLVQSLERKVEEAGKEQQQKKGFKAKKLQDKAAAAGDLGDTKAEAERAMADGRA